MYDENRKTPRKLNSSKTRDDLVQLKTSTRANQDQSPQNSNPIEDAWSEGPANRLHGGKGKSELKQLNR